MLTVLIKVTMCRLGNVRYAWIYIFPLFCLGLVTSECPHGWRRFKNSCYYFSTESLNWFLAESSCRGHNARLAEVYDKEHSDYLLNITRTLGGDGYWLGGRDDVVEGEWVWASTDERFDFSAWYPRQPSNGGATGNEDCVNMWSHFNMLWNDASCMLSYRFVCEKIYPGGQTEVIG